MPWPITEPGDPNPRHPAPTPSKGGGSPSDPTGTTLPKTVADQGRPLSICWGTNMVTVNVIEALPASSANPNTWQPSASYNVGAFVTSDSGANAYECITQGTSAGSGGPTGTGSNITDGSVHWKFRQANPFPLYAQYFLGALAEGEVQGCLSLWWDKEKAAAPGLTAAGRNLFLLKGPDSLLQGVGTSFDSSGYQHTAAIMPFSSPGAYSGTKAEIPNIAVELQGIMFGASGNDVNPADIISDLFTHTRRGCGLPSGRLDATTVTGAGATSYRTYCDAAGFRLSMLLDSQSPALQILGDLLGATNSDAVWSGGALKIVPLGDQSITSPVYGAVNYVPATTAAYNLGVDDFLDKLQPVQIVRRSDTDCFNSFPVEYVDRGQGYTRTTVDDPDQSDIDLRGGLRRASTTALAVAFPDGTYPLMLSRILAQRSLNVRNEYRFRLSWRYCLLEPTDIVTLTDPSIGLVNTPVRITAMEEDPSGGFLFTAEDYPSGVAASVTRPPAACDGLQPNLVSTIGLLASQVDGTRLAIAPSQVGAAQLTSGQMFDNLWPNPTSEKAPPTGINPKNDGNMPEFDYRSNQGAGAYAGDWVRALTFGQSSGITVPAAPGDSFYFEGYIKAAVAGANKGGFVRLFAVDKNNGVLLINDSTHNDTTTWTLESVTLTAPANTVAVAFRLNAGSDAAASAYFDAMYARRAVTRQILSVDALQTSNYAESGGFATAGAKLDSVGTALKVAPGNLLLGQTSLDQAWASKTWGNAGQIVLATDGAGAVSSCILSGGFGIASSVSYSAGFITVAWTSLPPGAGGVIAHPLGAVRYNGGSTTINKLRLLPSTVGSFNTLLAVVDSTGTLVTVFPISTNIAFDVVILHVLTSGYSL